MSQWSWLCCLIKLAHSGHCLPRTCLSKEGLQVELLCDRLLALIQYMNLKDCCNTTFLWEITKSTNKFSGFSYLSRLFLWYQNVNRYGCSRIYRMDVELLLDNRKEHLLGKYPLSRDVVIQGTSLALSNYPCKLKMCPWQVQAWGSPRAGETTVLQLPTLFFWGCVRTGSSVRWEAQSARFLPAWAMLCRCWRDRNDGHLLFYQDV